MSLSHADLPHILAVINAATVAVLLRGRHHIKAGNRDGHIGLMRVAIGLGAAFLALYLYYHFGAGLAKFGGVGLVRIFYFSLLIIHILTAAVCAVLAPLTIYRALAGDFARHQRLAKTAWPLWMFVSTSGLVVYFMTIHLYPFR